MKEVMMSPGASEGDSAKRAEPGLDCRLRQIEEAIAAAREWADRNEAEVRMERMMSRNDTWDTRYNALQDFGTAQARESIERLEAERDAIEAERAEFKAWCKERYGSGDDE